MAENKNMTETPEDDEYVVTLELDDGTELTCVVLSIFPVGKRDYIALLPEEDVDTDDGNIYFYRYSEVDGTPKLDNIEDDEEMDAVLDAFDELLDEQEYDELVGDDEE